MIKIGNAAAFWGDDIDAAQRLLQSEPNLDYLTLDYLAEVSLSIMASQREKNPEMGYARDFLHVLKTLIPFWQAGARCKVITNAGGLNPGVLGKLCREEITKAGLDLKIGVIEGDNVLSQLQKDPSNGLYQHMDQKKSLSAILPELITANAYIGAGPIMEALSQGAHIVIGGRIADPSLTVGPCLYHYQWKENDYHKIAGATVAGHIIECGTQTTGGISCDWLSLQDVNHLGFPIAEIDDEGQSIITKPLNTGGSVSKCIVTEQLLYEIGDPSNYKSPDATVSFLNLRLKELKENHVLVTGALGTAPPDTYKVSATFRAGYNVEAYLFFFGEKVISKAHRAGEMIFSKVREAGFTLEASSIETIGAGAVVPGFNPPSLPIECALRIAARSYQKEALEFLAKQIAPIVTSGPQGTTGYLSGRPQVRPVFGFWPCKILKKDLNLSVEII